MKADAPVITIDGPSGSGKGTVAREVAARLGFHLLDSGAIYRVTALAAAQAGIDADNVAGLARLAESLQLEFALASEGLVRVMLNGKDVSKHLRTEQCGLMASRIAALPEVRSALLARQKAFRELPGLVADGRDMGTVVFPDAQLKIFLTASAEERAKRRFLQLKQQGVQAIMESLVKEIQERDENDRNRSVSPLVPAGDALVIDSSDLAVHQVVTQIMQHWQQKVAG